MKIILVGGGTLGSVSPLIGVWQSLNKKGIKADTLFVGSKNGPEKKFISRYSIAYQAISCGKFRRYFSLKIFFDVFKFGVGFIQSIFILVKFQPDVIISAGSFVAVPVILAAKFFKAKVILYQPDLKPGLANKLCTKRADYIFTAFSETANNYPSNKVQAIGTVLRHEIKEVRLKIKDQRSRLLILGGGTGSEAINQLITESINQLIIGQRPISLWLKKSINQLNNFQIIHVTGKGKDERRKTKDKNFNYQAFELLTDDYYQKMAEADLVISRAGVSTLMELSYLAKPAVLIPLPNSPQEQNAEYFCGRNGAICLKQTELTPEVLLKKINELMPDSQRLNQLGKNIKLILKQGGEDKIAQKIYEFKQY